MSSPGSATKRRFLAFGAAYVRFCEAREHYQQTATGPDPAAMAHVSRLAREVLALAPAPDEITRASRQLGIPAPLPPAAYAAALDEVEFLADPKAYLAKRGTYQTAIDGKPVTLTAFGDEVLAIGDGDEIARAAGPGHFRPVPGGVQ